MTKKPWCCWCWLILFFFLSSFLFLQQPCPDIKCEFYELLHQLLLHNWRYFFRASLLAYMSMAEETVENQAQFNSVMQVCNRFDPCCNLRASNKAWNHVRRCRSLISKKLEFPRRAVVWQVSKIFWNSIFCVCPITPFDCCRKLRLVSR